MSIIRPLALCCLFLAGSGLAQGQAPEPPLQGAAELPRPDDTQDAVEAVLAALDLKERVSQLMIVTMQGLYGPRAEDLALLKSYKPGGAVIRQIVKPSDLAVYVTKLRGLEAITGIPLLVGADLYRLAKGERGLPSGFVPLPSLLSLAAAADDAATARLAGILAEHMDVMGFNLYLGPNLNLAPTLPGARGSIDTFGSDPDFAAQAGTTIVQAMTDKGVLAMPKGFPGGGANRLARPSSSAGPGSRQAVLLTPRPFLEDHDLLPYKRAIAAGVRLLHVGNTLVPTLDPAGKPASISKAVLTDLLRDELGYSGVVVAGPMDSADITQAYDAADAAIQAMQNGADMTYWLGPDTAVMRTADKIVQAVVEGRLEESKLNDSVRRVLLLKASLAQSERQMPSQQKMASSLEDKKELLEKTLAVEGSAITLVQNRNAVLPLTKAGSMPLGVTGVVGVDILHAALEKHMKPIAQQAITTARHMGEIQAFEIERITSHIRGIRTVVCVLTDAERPGGQVRLVRALKEKGVNVVLVLLGFPNHLPKLAVADAVVLAYCDPATYQGSLAAMADVLVGEGPVGILRAAADAVCQVGEKRSFDVYDLVRVPAGRLPVTVSEDFQAGLAIPYDPAMAIKKAEWIFGDGKRSKALRAEHAYSAPGRYAVSLTITGLQGDKTARTFHIQVHE